METSQIEVEKYSNGEILFRITNAERNDTYMTNCQGEGLWWLNSQGQGQQIAGTSQFRLHGSIERIRYQITKKMHI